MSQYIHAVPNFSEGRRSDVINAIVAQLQGLAGIKLIDFYPKGFSAAWDTALNSQSRRR